MLVLDSCFLGNTGVARLAQALEAGMAPDIEVRGAYVIAGRRRRRRLSCWLSVASQVLSLALNGIGSRGAAELAGALKRGACQRWGGDGGRGGIRPLSGRRWAGS